MAAEQTLEAQLDPERDLQCPMSTGHVDIEGVGAFLSKRAGRFVGR